ncbi:MAG: hypothetical protein V1907_02675 [Candidatus Kerfeldbacteria bacterium]
MAARDVPLARYLAAIAEHFGCDVRPTRTSNLDFVPDSLPTIEYPQLGSRFVVMKVADGRSPVATIMAFPFLSGSVTELYAELEKGLPRLWHRVQNGTWRSEIRAPKPAREQRIVRLSPKRASIYLATKRLVSNGYGLPNLPAKIAEQFGKQAGWHVTALRQQKLLTIRDGRWYVNTDVTALDQSGKPLEAPVEPEKPVLADDEE